jgi:hypothetical protein
VVSLWIVALIIPAVLLASFEGGFRIGRRIRSGDDEARLSHGMLWEAAVLALLGLLIGFAFAMAVDRFNARRELIVEEANAIETTWLRAGMLPEPARQELRGLLDRYVDTRVAFYEARTRADFEQAEVASSDLRTQIWSRVVAAAGRDPHSTMTALLVASTNELIDLAGKRMAAVANHVPLTVFIVLVLVAATSIASVGYTCGLVGKRLWFGMVAIPLVIAAVILLVYDMAHPRQGLIRTGEPSMLRLQRAL